MMMQQIPMSFFPAPLSVPEPRPRTPSQGGGVMMDQISSLFGGNRGGGAAGPGGVGKVLGKKLPTGAEGGIPGLSPEILQMAMMFI